MKRTYAVIGLLVLTALILAACQGRPSSREATASFFAMDTYMQLSAYGADAQVAAEEAQAEVERLEELLSTNVSGSEVARLNRGEDVSLSSDTEALIASSLDYYEETAGAYDITIYPIVRAWGFTTGEYRVLDAAETAALLPLVGSDKLHLSAHHLRWDEEGMMLDLGTIAKGYASDRIVAILRERGIEHAIINLGGNVHALGTRPDGSDWRVAIQTPEADAADTSYVGILSCHDVAVTTAGGYERYFEEDGRLYSHIFDPRTGLPVEGDLKSASVVAGDGITADGYDTALFVMGREAAIDFWRTHSEDFSIILVGQDDTIYLSEELAPFFETTQETVVLSHTP